MAAQITGSVGSYESGARNNTADIKTVQSLLTEAARRLRQPSFDPGGIDGMISRTANRSGTVKAIGNFQRTQVGLRTVDFRIDVGGKTWQTLVRVASSAAAAPVVQRPVASLVTLTVQHGNKIPKVTTGRDATVTTLYESIFTLSGGISGTYKGSIYPDDMNVKGRLIDGTYPLHIGFHKGGGEPKQTAADLVYRTEGIRAGLLVNARNSVSVQSNSSSKTTSVGINIHNGFVNQRYSDGCLTLLSTDWKAFIEKMLSAYPDIADWHTMGANTGKKIGSLVIKP